MAFSDIVRDTLGTIENTKNITKNIDIPSATIKAGSVAIGMFVGTKIGGPFGTAVGALVGAHVGTYLTGEIQSMKIIVNGYGMICMECVYA